MSELTKSIPRNLYVARTDGRGAEEILGYIVVADNKETKKFINQKASADAWARSKFEPLEFENKPMAGFRIINNVSRHTTSNVVWRIEHPLGFEFEIYSDNFLELIKGCIVNNGVFETELFLASNKVLTGVGLPTYENIKAKDDKLIKSKNTTINVGDYAYIETITVDKHGEENIKTEEFGFYAGRFHTLKTSKRYGSSIPDMIQTKSKLSHWFYNPEMKYYIMISDTDFKKLYVNKAKGKHQFPENIPEDIRMVLSSKAKPASKMYNGYYYWSDSDDNDQVVAVHTKPIKFDMFEVVKGNIDEMHNFGFGYLKNIKAGTCHLYLNGYQQLTPKNMYRSDHNDQKDSYAKVLATINPYYINDYDVKKRVAIVTKSFEPTSFESFNTNFIKYDPYSRNNPYQYNSVIQIDDLDNTSNEYEYYKLVFKGE